MKYVKNPTCPYCNKKADKISGAEIYPRRADLHNIRFWICDPCNAWVGTHRGTDIALGTLAKLELRRLRRIAHDTFDPIWTNQKNRRRARQKAYAWLAASLGLPVGKAHIAMLDVDQCEKVIEIVTDWQAQCLLELNSPGRNCGSQ